MNPSDGAQIVECISTLTLYTPMEECRLRVGPFTTRGTVVRSAGTTRKPTTKLDFWQQSYWQILVEVRASESPHLPLWEIELIADDEIARLEEQLENDLRLKGESNLPRLTRCVHCRSRKPKDW